MSAGSAGAGGVIAVAAHALIGTGIGFRFTQADSKRREIAQGANPSLASVMLPSEITPVCAIVYRMASMIPNPIIKTVIQVFANILPLLSIPFAIFCGTVRSRDVYPLFAGEINKYLWEPLQLPRTIEEMSERTLAIIDFISDHLGDILQVAMVVGSIALIALGSYVIGGCILGAMIYQVLDERLGVIPREISLFLEQYMPIISWIGILLSGGIVLQVLATLALISYIPGVFPFMMEKLDDGIHSIFRKFGIELPGAPLADIHAPLVQQKNLSFDQILAALNGTDENFEINPAHCSKQVFDLRTLPRDHNFDTLQRLFDAVPWNQRYAVIKNKLQDDDRFIDYLVQEYPSKTKQNVRRNIDPAIQELAQKKGISKEQFVANWIRDQMVGLVSVLKGEERVIGLQVDLADAINNCALLIPYLGNLSGKAAEIELETALLALAVEGGRYCARGIKRISSELVRTILQSERPQAVEAASPGADYELQLLQVLQTQRAAIVDRYYLRIMEALQLPDVIKNDVHGHDIYREYLSLGFYPLTPLEEEQMETVHHLLWETYHHQYVYHPSMFQEYRFGNARDQVREGTHGQQIPVPITQRGLDAAIHETGQVRVAPYLAAAIEANETLTREEKDSLLERLQASARNVNVQNHQLNRLLFVMLGVLRPKAQEADEPAPAEAAVPLRV